VAELDVKEAEVVLPERVVNPPDSNLTRFDKPTEVAHENIARLEDDMYAKAHQIIKDVLDFREVDLEDTDAALVRWIAEGMEPEEAQKRLQLAIAGWNKAAEMPGGVKLAQETFVGITKARSNQPTQHVHFHAEFVRLPEPQKYPELIEESD
jgi:hypothetical protein